MLHAKVVSSNIAEIFLDETTLIIGFNNGRYYAAPDFPIETWERWLAAESQGKFFHAEIKNNFTLTECSNPYGMSGAAVAA